MRLTTIEIAVCDDQPQVTDQLEIFLRQYFAVCAQEYHLQYFETPSEVFEYLEHGKIHILFMDLKFGTEDEDGMLWTRKIKDAFPKILVLILTGYEQRYKEGYRAGAFRFMTKPLTEQELTENMDDCMKEINCLREVWVKHKGLKFLLPVKDILFIEAYIGESKVHAKDHDFNSEQTLSQWEKELEGEHFFRINKSFLIPLSQVAEILINRHEVQLPDGTRLQVSRRKWMEFRRVYTRYDVEKNDVSNKQV